MRRYKKCLTKEVEYIKSKQTKANHIPEKKNALDGINSRITEAEG